MREAPGPFRPAIEAGRKSPAEDTEEFTCQPIRLASPADKTYRATLQISEATFVATQLRQSSASSKGGTGVTDDPKRE